jgi:hypothetical protein
VALRPVLADGLPLAPLGPANARSPYRHKPDGTEAPRNTNWTCVGGWTAGYSAVHACVPAPVSHNGTVLLRRLLLLVALLLVISAIASALRPSEFAPAPKTTPAPKLPVGTATTEGNPNAREVSAVLPDGTPVKAQVGDLVSLTFKAQTPDVASIAGLGITFAVAPQEGTPLQFMADTPGSFPVTLQGTGTTIGTLEITAPR